MTSETKKAMAVLYSAALGLAGYWIGRSWQVVDDVGGFADFLFWLWPIATGLILLVALIYLLIIAVAGE